MHQGQFPKFSEIAWSQTLFLCLVPIIGVLGSAFAIYREGFSWSLLLFSVVFAGATSLSMTLGYHRLFSHRSFEAHPLVRRILIIFSTCSWQSSILKWCTDHRVHHSRTDSEEDPYSINRGFWYAHFGWMLFKNSPDFQLGCPDLQKDSWIRFQNQYYVPLAIITGFLFPWAVGAWFGHPLTGFFMAGALRIGFTQQTTFFVNSLCHTLGKKPYSENISARDSWFVALLTHGEGYHNFHHQFQIDYRNGIAWWQWDPTKWSIRLLSLVGLASQLRTVSSTEILKARLQMEALKLKSKGYSQDKLEQLKDRVLTSQVKLRELVGDYQLLKKQWQDQSQEKLEQLRTEIKLAQLELNFTLQRWRTLMNSPVVLVSI